MTEIRLNAFDMNCVVHQSPGLWRHPRDRSSEYGTLRYWTDVARILERGLFDGLFVADVLGAYDVYGGNLDAALRNATQIPLGDPSVLVPAMAMVTEHLGFGITCTLTYEPPYPFARRMSTLDHLTGGRVGWNIVTGYLNSAAKGMAGRDQPTHDDRYAIAEEYMEIMYKLWEGSWEDDAVMRDRAGGVFTRPDRVHVVHHDGPNWRIDAAHLCEPSPQRSPLLYQAGASAKGRAFAGRHAECVFVSAPTAAILAPRVAGLRADARAAGRNPRDMLIFAQMTVIPGVTDAAAAEKFAEYTRYVSHEGALTLMSGWTGIDFSQYDPDEPVRHVKNDAIHSAVEALTSADPDRVWTVRDVAAFGAIGGMGPVVVGGPATVADAMQDFMVRTGVDGFNLSYAVTPESFSDFVDLIVPELQRRGVYKRAYAPGTLREKLFGRGPHLSAPHPGAGYRVRREALLPA